MGIKRDGVRPECLYPRLMRHNLRRPDMCVHGTRHSHRQPHSLQPNQRIDENVDRATVMTSSTMLRWPCQPSAGVTCCVLCRSKLPVATEFYRSSSYIPCIKSSITRCERNPIHVHTCHPNTHTHTHRRTYPFGKKSIFILQNSDVIWHADSSFGLRCKPSRSFHTWQHLLEQSYFSCTNNDVCTRSSAQFAYK